MDGTRGRVRLWLLAFAPLVACSSKPAEIRIKGPRDAVESTQKTPTFAPFETKGETLRLRASGFDDRGRYTGTVVVDWESSDPTVATVSQTGIVTFLSSGHLNVTATTKGAPKRSASLPLEVRIVSAIRITEPIVPENRSLNLAMGRSLRFEAEVLDDRGQPIPKAKVRWRSSSHAATVSPDGTVEGRAIGSGQIIAEGDHGVAARVNIEVGDWAKAERRR